MFNNNISIVNVIAHMLTAMLSSMLLLPTHALCTYIVEQAPQKGSAAICTAILGAGIFIIAHFICNEIMQAYATKQVRKAEQRATSMGCASPYARPYYKSAVYAAQLRINGINNALIDHLNVDAHLLPIHNEFWASIEEEVNITMQAEKELYQSVCFS